MSSFWMKLMFSVASLAIAGVATAGFAQSAITGAASENITVREGTSVAVSVSPDGQKLAFDLQGSIWVMPSTGGPAKRITGVFDDAHQPSWSPDGSEIVFFSYRAGNFNLWEVAPDGTNLRQLTTGRADDREPVFSHDGTRIAFSSDRGNPLGSDYNIFSLDVKSGEVHQLTTNPAEDTMPSWSPDDKEIAFVSTREGGRNIWAVSAEGGSDRKLADPTGRPDAVSWGPGGDVVVHTVAAGKSQLELNGTPITASGENVFPFRPDWISKSQFFYTADGKIKKHTLGTVEAQDVPFSATLEIRSIKGTYKRNKRNFDVQSPRKVRGIVHPTLSPDGKAVAFAALGDIYLMPIGGKPRAITHDAAFDTDPAWSPDGKTLVYSSDKVGGFLQLWLHDIAAGKERQLTHLAGQPMAPIFSPDGTKIAFLNFDGPTHASASIAVADVATGDIAIIHNSLFGPGDPTWSPDGKWIAVAALMPYSKKYREGTNQILVMSSSGSKDANEDKVYAPIPNVSLDSRVGSGPAWSPDGKYMAVVYGAQISLIPVSPIGEPTGPLKHAADDTAYSPNWSKDGRDILFLSNDKLKILDTASGKSRTVPVDLTYAQYVPKTQYVLHVGKLVDGISTAARSDMDIVITGNRISKIEPHVVGRKAIDLPELTAIPGLIDSHTHRSANFGELQGRALLAWGITTVRSPGGVPYFAVEDREASDAGVRVEPRIFDTGYLLDGSRIFYSENVSISSDAHLERELVRTRDLGFDFFKTYVRLPNQMQQRVVEFGHQYGMPSTSHELYPAALDGIDSVEHQGATSRRGYSLKNTFNRSYEDVTQIFGRARMSLTPTVFPGFRNLLDAYPELRSDPRLDLDPAWLKASMLAPARTPPPDISGICKMILDVQRAGGRIVAGTDMNDGMYMQAELYSYVKCGMSPYDALRAATVTPAELLNFDAGSIQLGKLADIVLVEGNPLDDIANTRHVKRVIANGRMFTQEDLLSGKAKDAPR